MDENRRPRRSRPRGRSPELAARLQRSRRKTRDLRTAAREREKIVTGAVRDYIAAWAAIVELQRRRDGDVDALHRQIAEVTQRANERIGDHEVIQARAAARIHAQGHTDDDIADLLEITPRHVRRLLAAARAGERSEQDQPDEPSTGVGRVPPVREQATEVADGTGRVPRSVESGGGEEHGSGASGEGEADRGHSGQ
ncbi:hypothetical protein [Nocardia terpenica]|uniref:hypothetical protein n=1 Tax=Nocardia terpenica TaxID=455432 RepID=UPI0012E85417|nr:hypothetical protein [Nocardia terpenica]NQE91176.1 hypothetical protein [Nocardia terpenica]